MHIFFEIVFIILAVIFGIGFFDALRKKEMPQRKRRLWLSGIACVVCLAGVSSFSSASSAPATTSATSPVASDAAPAQISPDELPLWIAVDIVSLEKSSSLSASDVASLKDIPPLVIQDEWNQEMGYFEYLSPATPTPLTDSQVTAILSAIQELRKQHSDQWFNVMIFDDPTIAQNARTADYANLPQQQYCAVFAHFRGLYSWNPTDQNEEMSIGMNCDWQSLL
ncbi:MAG TPA: hypothetical protein VMR46_01850 [Candidatus Paceibacterota bacterium]|nr:hypothetical protein [Candidatus Paceibacterota bacterium]